MFNTNFFQKLDNTILEAIHNAQIVDLVERRNIQDPALFEECFTRVTPEDGTIVDDIINFTDYAGAAFQQYHERRATQKAEAEAEADTEADATQKAPQWKVVMVSGSVKHDLMGGFDTEDEANTFAEEQGWHHLDENCFDWNLEVEEDIHAE